MTTNSASYLTELHQLINQHFNLTEIRTLCLDLNVDYESVAGEEKPSRIRELLLGLGRNGRLPELITLLQQERPNVTWPPVPDDFELPESLAAGEAVMPTNQYHVYGDIVFGDKVAGDKVMGNKYEHHHHYPPEKKPLPPPHMMPELPKDFVQRPQEYDQLIDYLLAGSGQTAAITTMLQGAGGFGKTTMASAICHDERIKAAFPDGILWVELGQKPTNLPWLIDDLIYALSRQRSGSTTALAAAVALADAIGDLSCLLVIDDVWREANLKPFLHGAPNCSRLITTRNAATLPQQSQLISVDAMQKSEALQLLCFQLVVGEDVPALAALSEQLGEWPLLLKLVNRVLFDRSQRQPLVAAIGYVNQALKKRGVIGFDVRDAAGRELAVSQTIEVSLDLLREDERQRYDELATFPEDSDIPLQIVHRLWHATANWDDFDTEELCGRLQQFSLLLDFNLADQTIRLHDVFRNYLLKKAPAERVRDWHEALLTDYHEQCEGDWSQLPDDSYVYQNLLWHMREAGKQDKLEQLLFSYDWLDAKLQVTDVLSLISDFNLRQDTKRHSQLGLLQHALQVSASVLMEDKNQLSSQLYGRLSGLGRAWQTFADGIEQQKQVYWLQTQSPSLTPPGGNLIYTLNDHTAPVSNLLLTDDGRLLSSCHSFGDYTVKVWNIEQGNLLHNLAGHTAPVSNLLLTGAGHLISSCCNSSDSIIAIFNFTSRSDHTVKVWDIEQGTLLHSLEGHTDGVTNLLLTDDGRLITSCRSDISSSDHTVKVWDIEQGTLLHSLEDHANGVDNLLLTGNGHLITSCRSGDHTVKVWDIEWGTLLHNLQGHTDGVSKLLLTKDGRLITSCGSGIKNLDHTVKVWDIERGILLHSLEGHTDGVTNLLLTDDGRLITSCSSVNNLDHTVKVWDIKRGTLLYSLEGHINGVANLLLTSNGRLLSSCSNGMSSRDHTVKVWDIERGTLLHSLEGHTDEVSNLLLAADSDRLFSSCSSSIRIRGSTLSRLDRTVKVWDIEQGILLDSLEGHTDGVDNLLLTGDGHLITSCSNDISSLDHTVKVWDIKRVTLLHRLQGHTGAVDNLLLTNEGHMLSSCSSRTRSSDYTVKVWNKQGTLLHNLKGHAGGVDNLLLTGDGRTISSCSDSDYTVKVWNIERGTLLHSLEGHIDAVDNLLLTNNGRLITSCRSFDHTVKVWDIERGTLLHSLEGHIDAVDNLLLTGDGRMISSCSDSINDYTMKVWDIGRGTLLHTLESHIDGVSNLLLTSDRHLISSCSGRRDYTVKVWDIEHGTLLHTLEGHIMGVDNLLLTGDGRLVSSCRSGDHTVKVWDIERGTLLHSLEGHIDAVDNLLLTGDGHLVSSCSGRRDYTVKVWDIERGTLLHNLKGHTNGVDNLLLTGDGRLLSSGNGTTKVWDIERGILLHSLTGHISGILPISGYFMTIGGTQLSIWELDEGIQVAGFTADASISSYAITPDDTIILGDGLGRVHFLKLIGSK